jgi:flagellar motor switch protein FliN/FliY
VNTIDQINPAGDPLAGNSEPPAEIQHPAFAELSGTAVHEASLDRFMDVQVEVSVAMGSTKLPIGKLARIGPGSVIELNRKVTDLVEIVAQGLPIAQGEIVVIGDRYAVRVIRLERRHAG